MKLTMLVLFNSAKCPFEQLIFPRRHKLVHKGGLQNFEALYFSKNTLISTNFCKPLVKGTQGGASGLLKRGANVLI